MARLFISYSHQDRHLAEKLAHALTARDHEVWWDRNLGSGDAFRHTIEQQLKECEASIVIWSENSVQSRWVLDEADKAVGGEKLLPVSFDPNIIAPMGFGQFHVMDFSAWGGAERSPELEELDTKITEILHGNFRNAMMEIGRRAGENRGGKTAAMLISSVGSNIGGLPVTRLLAGAVATGGGLALLQLGVGFWFGFEPIEAGLAALAFIPVFGILRVAHQPVALRLGRARRFFDDSFAFWLVFSLFAATLYGAALSLFVSIDPIVFVRDVPPLALTLMAVLVFLRLFWTGFSFLMRKV